MTVTLQDAFTPLPSVADAVMVAVPAEVPFTTPFPDTIATLLLLVVHLTVFLVASDGCIDTTDTVDFFPTPIVSLVLPRVILLTGTVTFTSQTFRIVVLFLTP